MGSRFNAALIFAGALAIYGCTLDFGKWEGAGQGGAGGTPLSCSNDVLDADETDVDCGGGMCDPCANDGACTRFSDCLSQHCDAGTCAPCATSADCADAAGTYCSGGTCVDLKDAGVACTTGEECATAICADDVCCDGACEGTCESCIGADNVTGVTGECSAILGTTDPDGECAPQICGGGNACADFCGLQPPPPGEMCPAVCTGGCAAGVCTISCAGSACQGTVTCPVGFACDVDCGSMGSCQDGIIQCPDHYACSVSCSSNTACRRATVHCSTTGVCEVSCTADQNVCRDVTLNCGENDCTATCAAGGGMDAPNVNCGANACTCTPC